MFNLSSYLDKFKNIVPHDKVIREKCREYIEKQIGYNMDKSQIKVQGESILMQAPAVIKHELERMKEDLLKHINQDTKTIIKSIRFY